MSARTVETPDLQPNTATVAKYSVDKYYEEKSAFEAAEMTVTDQELSLGSQQHRLYHMQELRLTDDTTIELLFSDAASVLVRFATVAQRADAQMEIKRLFQVALDNRLIEEAEEQLAAFEEGKAIQ